MAWHQEEMEAIQGFVVYLTLISLSEGDLADNHFRDPPALARAWSKQKREHGLISEIEKIKTDKEKSTPISRARIIKINNQINAAYNKANTDSAAKLIAKGTIRFFAWLMSIFIGFPIAILIGSFTLPISLYNSRSIPVYLKIPTFFLFMIIGPVLYVSGQISLALMGFLSLFYHIEATLNKLDLHSSVKWFLQNYHEDFEKKQLALAEKIYGDKLNFDDLLAYQQWFTAQHKMSEEKSDEKQRLEEKIWQMQDCIDFFGKKTELSSCVFSTVDFLSLLKPYYIEVPKPTPKAGETKAEKNNKPPPPLTARYHVFDKPSLLKYWETKAEDPLNRTPITDKIEHADGFPPEIEAFLLQVAAYKNQLQAGQLPEQIVAAKTVPPIDIFARASAVTKPILSKLFPCLCASSEEKPANTAPAPVVASRMMGTQ